MQSAQLKKSSDSGVIQTERQGLTGWPSATGEIIVDTQDKEAWPSIGDKSEAASDCGDNDNASVKSVISSSSVPSQGHGDISSQGQGSSAMQGQSQSASSLWGATMTSNRSEGKLDSDNTWGISPQTPLSAVWDSSDKSAANQEVNMQTLPNGISSSGSVSNLLSGSTPRSSAGGWGDFPMNNTSGAQNDQGNRAGSGESNSFGSAMWQGIHNMSGGLSDIGSKEAASGGSGWSSRSTSNSVIGPGLSISSVGSGSAFNAKGVSAMNQDSAVGQWGQTPPSNSMWGSSSAGGSDAKSEGWGSPCPSPITNAGTEGWGAPEQQQQQRKPQSQAWGQSPTTSSSPGWDQSKRRPSSSAWEAAPPPERTSSNWGDPSKPYSGGSGSGGGWQNSTQSQFGGSGASGPQSQWPGGSASQPPSSSSSNQIGAWGSGNPITAATPQPSQPMGSMPPDPMPPSLQQTPPAQPGSWAEAAGRGLPNTKPSPVGSTNRKVTRDDVISQAINSVDGWGKMPIRQDTNWDNVEESPKMPRKPLGSSSSTGSQEDLHWNQPNNGTAIWESTKESAPPPPTPVNIRERAGASGSTNEWGVSSDNDGGTWNGGGQPDSNNSNVWQGPPPQNPNNSSNNPNANPNNTWNQPPKSNMWGGNDERPGSNSWSSGSSESNDSKKNTWQGQRTGSQGGNGSGSGSGSSQGGPGPGGPGPGGPGQGQGGKSDNVWDRNGTSLWGDPEKTETGTWASNEGMRRNSSSGSWDAGDSGPAWNSQSRDNRAAPDNGGTAYWGNPEKPPGQWNNSNPVTPMTPQPIPGRPMDKPMWVQPPQQPKSNWGDMSPPGGPGGRDDALWNPGGKPPGWGDGQWQRPKHPSSNWGDGGDWNNMSAARKPPQRSRMLQQLMDMGFKKEDAQNSLIRNDMDLDRAIRDLVASAKRPDYDVEMRPGRQLKGISNPEDLADPTIEPSPFLPHQNTLTNAQGLPNTQVIATPYPKQGPSLPPVSSLCPPSINALQHKLLPQQLKPPGGGPPTQPMRAPMPNQTQQVIQAQIVQQLQMAVQAGLISPQLLNQHLTPAMLVMLQQLLQLQQVYQQLVAQQQVLQQNKSMPPMQQRCQLETVSLTIAKIKQKITQAQHALAKQASVQQPPTGMDPNKELLKDLQDDIQNLHLKDVTLAAQQQQQQVQQPMQNQAQQPQSRLNQWKLPSPEKDLAGGALSLDLNRAPGSRPLPHSTPNLQNKLDPSAQFSDPWANLPSSTSSLWPSTSTTTTTAIASSPQSDTKTSTVAAAADDKESPEALLNSGEMGSLSGANPATATATCSDDELDIAEFVPGKPWQGIAKSVEDDPHMTPSQVMRRSVSISTIKDDYVMNTLTGKSEGNNSLNTSPTVSDSTALSSANWASGSSSLMSSSVSPNLAGRSSWSATLPTESAPSMFMSGDIWGMSSGGNGGPPKSRRPPPGLMNRSVSCPGGPGNWGSNWLILKNLPTQIDGPTVKNLCNQQGALQTFLHSAQFGQAYVCYKSREDAIKAQKALGALVFGTTAIMADFVSDADVARLQELSSQSAAAVPSSTGGGHWSQQPLPSGVRPAFNVPKFEQAAQLNGAANFSGVSGGANMWGSGGSGGGPWGAVEEHPDMLPGGLLGGH